MSPGLRIEKFYFAHEVSMKQNVKDITARYGGEFVIALPNTTLRSAITVADHQPPRGYGQGIDETIERRAARAA
jgi:GGDEF domain-containing protein